MKRVLLATFFLVLAIVAVTTLPLWYAFGAMYLCAGSVFLIQLTRQA